MNFRKYVATGFASLFILAGCGGGNNASNTTGGGGTVTGTAGTGSPVVGGTVTVTDSSTSPISLTAATNADGTYSISGTDSLTFPVRITVSFAEGGAIRTLRSIAVEEDEDGSTRANINPITDVIAGSIEGINDIAILNSEITRLSAVLASVLVDYGIVPTSDFFGGVYVANPTDPVDKALDMVSVQLDSTGNNIVLQSTVDPAITPTIIGVEDAQPETSPKLPAPADNAFAPPSDIKTLVDAFGADLARGINLNSADLNDVFHEDYQDDDGFTQTSFAETIAADAENEDLELTVTGYKILRCFADQTSITDKCYIRVNFTSPSLEGEDFGGTTGGATVSDFIDLIAERRNAGPLKFSGGYFKPFSANIKLFNSNEVIVNNEGVALVNEVVNKGLSINARVAGSGSPTEPDETANANLQTIELIRNVGAIDESIVMSVTRSALGQCVGSNNRLNVDPANNNCGNQLFGGTTDQAAADSAQGLLTAVFIDNSNPAVEIDVPNVRIVDPSSSALSSFGTLNQTSLQNLIAFAGGAGESVSITLTPPQGASFVCISDGGNNEDVCTYASRTISIPASRIARTPNYFVITRDAENNTFQRQYILNQER